MVQFDIRHVVPSSSGRRALIGDCENQVAIQDLVAQTLLGPFTVTSDFGSQRIALSDQLDGLVTATYHVHGTAFYSAKNGQEIWRRKDIKKVQRISLSRDGMTAFCGIEGAPLVVLDLRTGETLTKIRATQSIHQSEWDAVTFIDGTHPHVDNATGERLSSVRRMTFAFLDVTFSPGFICLSESGGYVRCLDVDTGSEIWRYQPPKNSHVLHIGYHKGLKHFVGVQWPYMYGGMQCLIHLSSSDGTLLADYDIGTPTISSCFALQGSLLVLSDRRILDSGTAKEIAHIG